MKHKLKIQTIPIDHWFESEQDKELYRRINFPSPSELVSAPTPPESKTLWIDEAITYLGLNRIGLTRPDKAIHRLINKGALHPKKISGRLCFDRAELDKVLANGDHKQGRGRPRKR